MKFLIITGNPKKDGLCYSEEEELIKGASDGGAEAEILRVEKLERCKVCCGGWGSCREKHISAFGGDGFNDSQETGRAAHSLCFITPVYWGEAAEGLKSFIDRLRRCEFDMPWQPRPEDSKPALSGKQALLVASPGGSGNGILTCLEQMDRFCRHTGAVIFDYIGVNRWNNDYKKKALYAAARAMAEGRRAGKTL
jgi:multimeric flavodoxin WrbA